MEAIRILLVEDERGISDIEKSYLCKEGYEVLQAFDGEKALEFFHNEKIDLIILDRMLPVLSGEEVIREVRAHSEVPIIMVTAKVEEDDRVEGLKMGADDYVTKPFSPRELIQRVRTILRRMEKYKLPKAELVSLDHGRLQLDFETGQVRKDDQLIPLTNNEFRIVKALFSNPKKIFTREEIIDIAFGLDYDAYDRAIDTHIKNIRHKLEDNPKSPEYIKTVYGMGYRAGGLDEVKK